MSSTQPAVLLATCQAWYLPHTAQAFYQRGSLAEIWLSDKCRTAVPAVQVRRCWPFHLAMKLFYHTSPQIVVERLLYGFFPVWKQWVNAQRLPEFNVVQAIMGYASEVFERGSQTGALKVLDCQNSHPVSYRGYWQRECDIWCPGERVPIPDWMFARMNRELEMADLILCPSTFVRDTMITNGLPSCKLRVVPFGVNTAIFKPRAAVPARPRFISVGTICLRKGHHYLLQAFDLVKKTLPEAELILVGDIKTDFRLQRKKWEGSYTYIPLITQEKLATLLVGCSAFVLASVEEGFARVIPEALAAGLPLIGTYESGAGTVVRDGIEGFIVPSRNPLALAEAMIKSVTDLEGNREMGVAAAARGSEANTWQDYGDRLLHEYAEKLNERRVG